MYSESKTHTSEPMIEAPDPSKVEMRSEEEVAEELRQELGREAAREEIDRRRAELHVEDAGKIAKLSETAKKRARSSATFVATKGGTALGLGVAEGAAKVGDFAVKKPVRGLSAIMANIEKWGQKQMDQAAKKNPIFIGIMKKAVPAAMILTQPWNPAAWTAGFGAYKTFHQPEKVRLNVEEDEKETQKWVDKENKKAESAAKKIKSQKKKKDKLKKAGLSAAQADAFLAAAEKEEEEDKKKEDKKEDGDATAKAA